MARRLGRATIVLAMMLVLLLLCLDVAYFVNGSLEEFPTDEQQDKIRVVTAWLATVLIAIELVLWQLLIRLTAPRPAVGDGSTEEH